MRRWACFSEPIPYSGAKMRKIMLYQPPSGEVCAFLYTKEDAQICSADEWYPSLEDALSVWDAKPHSPWIAADDPLPGCQADALEPIRVRGRAEGKPRWGEYELLCCGVWREYRP